ncbi:MAG: hypothetical protein ACREQF_01790 [Candidatus Binataceae bacterium]
MVIDTSSDPDLFDYDSIFASLAIRFETCSAQQAASLIANQIGQHPVHVLLALGMILCTAHQPRS